MSKSRTFPACPALSGFRRSAAMKFVIVLARHGSRLRRRRVGAGRRPLRCRRHRRRLHWTFRGTATCQGAARASPCWRQIRSVPAHRDAMAAISTMASPTASSRQKPHLAKSAPSRFTRHLTTRSIRSRRIVAEENIDCYFRRAGKLQARLQTAAFRCVLHAISRRFTREVDPDTALCTAPRRSQGGGRLATSMARCCRRKAP